MFDYLIALLYNYGCGLKRASKFHKTIDMIEELTDDELKKAMRSYNSNKCC